MYIYDVCICMYVAGVLLPCVCMHIYLCRRCVYGTGSVIDILSVGGG